MSICKYSPRIYKSTDTHSVGRNYTYPSTVNILIVVVKPLSADASPLNALMPVAELEIVYYLLKGDAAIDHNIVKKRAFIL